MKKHLWKTRSTSNSPVLNTSDDSHKLVELLWSFFACFGPKTMFSLIDFFVRVFYFFVDILSFFFLSFIIPSLCFNSFCWLLHISYVPCLFRVRTIFAMSGQNAFSLISSTLSFWVWATIQRLHLTEKSDLQQSIRKCPVSRVWKTVFIRCFQLLLNNF